MAFLKDHGFVSSTRGVGSCYDNGVAESLSRNLNWTLPENVGGPVVDSEKQAGS